jgi:hexosaminidase
MVILCVPLGSTSCAFVVKHQHMKKTTLIFTFLILASLAFATEPLPIIPKPVSLKTSSGAFALSAKTPVIIAKNDKDLSLSANFLADFLMNACGMTVEVKNPEKGKSYPAAIYLNIKDDGKIAKEGYELTITPKKITLRGGSGAGLFHGIQTLIQLMPQTVYKNGLNQKEVRIQCLTVKDHPRFPYRGMHLDVSRHFFPKEFVKRYIDLIAMYKMNTFHWHLTDDNGWRIEIKKYPKLTSVGAWHVDRGTISWRDQKPQEPGEKATCGGFYTQDEIKDIIQYAADRYVTIIPEIEMPAHSVEVLAAYPELSCTGGPFTVPPGTYWPNIDILCAGNDSVFIFMDNVLTEVAALFPGKYIHVGGDEADKTRWKSCPKCQARIKNEGLKDEKELQSYFMKRIEKIVTAKGKKMIGWDEILEGGLAPEAIVMSWRGIEGGIAAARMGHDVIMTPTSHCYLDYYQGDPQFEPEAIGGNVTLKKVYGYDPVPGELKPDQVKYILGVQGNLWSEFIPTPSHAEYMAVPRMIALAEVAWTPKAQKNWSDFRKRLQLDFTRLDWMKVNYSRGTFKCDIRTFTDPKDKKFKIRIESEQEGVETRYTTDGSDPTSASSLYEKPFVVTGDMTVKAGLFENGQLRQKPSERKIIMHLATGKKVKYIEPYSYRYTAGGDGGLTDGILGAINHRDGCWQGYLGNNMEAIVDLGKETELKEVSINFLQAGPSWIFMPEKVIFSISDDGKEFRSVKEDPNDVDQHEKSPVIKNFKAAFPNEKARYIKVKAQANDNCPSWHEGTGEKCWIFCDEIVVR